MLGARPISGASERLEACGPEAKAHVAKAIATPTIRKILLILKVVEAPEKSIKYCNKSRANFILVNG